MRTINAYTRILSSISIVNNVDYVCISLVITQAFHFYSVYSKKADFVKFLGIQYEIVQIILTCNCKFILLLIILGEYIKVDTYLNNFRLNVFT